MVLMKISYKLQAHNIAYYDSVWADEVLPLIKEYGFNLRGVWRNIVGTAGEYLELWEFDSMAEFETNWTRFMKDPRLLAAFQKTGPVVIDEQIALFEPLHTDRI
ncbi:MAG: NIPSNAP family protein [Blastocatellia bacterium]|nr:NIPSNAP family protein [Blastocatellia bacterium]